MVDTKNFTDQPRHTMLLKCTITIHDIHESQIQILVHKFIHHKKKLPTISKSYFNIHNSLYHNNTHGRNSLHIDSCNTTTGIKPIKYKDPKLLNELSSHLKCNSTNKFTSLLKIYLRTQTL